MCEIGSYPLIDAKVTWNLELVEEIVIGFYDFYLVAFFLGFTWSKFGDCTFVFIWIWFIFRNMDIDYVMVYPLLLFGLGAIG